MFSAHNAEAIRESTLELYEDHDKNLISFLKYLTINRRIIMLSNCSY